MSTLCLFILIYASQKGTNYWSSGKDQNIRRNYKNKFGKLRSTNKKNRSIYAQRNISSTVYLTRFLTFSLNSHRTHLGIARLEGFAIVQPIDFWPGNSANDGLQLDFLTHTSHGIRKGNLETG